MGIYSSPTWGQIKCLVDMAKNAIKGWGLEETPTVLLLAMITIISQEVNSAEAQNLVHWAFVPHPPLPHVVTWKNPLYQFLLMTLRCRRSLQWTPGSYFH
jgi:hypothetical protein